MSDVKVENDINMQGDTITPSCGCVIRVIGVGGGGNNALQYMMDKNLAGVECMAINTDPQTLERTNAKLKVQIGVRTTNGLGAGCDPNKGRKAAEESYEDIKKLLSGSDMVFITAGMGGGTGTGAAPVVAQIAKEMDILTVAVVTKPFLFEREQKMLQAERGIAELRKYVDSLIVIPNEKLLVGFEKPLTMRESFSLADDILKTGVKSISDLITDDGFINLDFADVSTIMKGAGYAHMAIGHGQGKDKATDAAKAVISSPLLETSISGANRLLINIAMSEDVLAEDVDTATKMITDTAADDVEFIFGTAFKEDMQDEMRITVIAAGFGEPKSVITPVQEKPVVSSPVVDEAPVVKTPVRKSSPISSSISSSSDEDDLDAIFKILDNKK